MSDNPKLTVWQRWLKLETGEVIRQWSFDGKRWDYEVTAHKDVPYVKLHVIAENLLEAKA